MKNIQKHAEKYEESVDRWLAAKSAYAQTATDRIAKYHNEFKQKINKDLIDERKDIHLYKLYIFLFNNFEITDLINYAFVELEENLNAEHKAKKLILDELILLKREALKNLDTEGIKKSFERDLKFVRQNDSLYSVLFNYMEYIKEDILRDKLGYPDKKTIRNIEVFRYIAGILFEITSDSNLVGQTEKRMELLTEKVKSYYNHKFKFIR